MSIQISRKSTIMDQQGRIFVPREITKAIGLTGASAIEWFIGEDGRAGFRKVTAKKTGK